MQIGDLSRLTGVNIETIRYYERAGVLPLPSRQANGRRRYGDNDVCRLGFIRNARELGFDLENVRKLISLQEDPKASCEEASSIAQCQLDAVESKITRLMALKEELARMIHEFKRELIDDCRVIEALKDQV